jgi:LysM repeat protein
MKKNILLITMVFCATIAKSQNLTPIQYIEQYKDLAIREMKRMGVPAAITLAQGLLETESGNSKLLKKSNNHFGIKCKSNWTGIGVSHDDDEIGECFRTYKDAEESYRDHSNFLRSSDRYAPLFKLDPTDYKGWAKGLRKAGYATNPKYPDILIKNIEQYDLQQYSLAAAGEVPVFEPEKYEDDKAVPFVWSEDSAAKSTDTGKIATTPTNFTEGIQSVNGAKCTFAKKGTSLLAIASQNNIQLSRLLEFNDFKSDGILQKDQVIFLQKKAMAAASPFYITNKDESPLDMAQQYGIQLQALLDYNNISGNSVIPAGTKLYLQNAKPAWQTQENNSATDTKKVHEVQPKEGLFAISKKYNVTVKQIKEWNNLASDSLSIGQQLIIAQ